MSDGFDELYQAAFGRLVGQVYLVTGDLAEAEDAVQEAFARASARWATVGHYAAPESWVRRVAMNLAVDGLRRARRRLAALARLGPGPVVPPVSADRVALAEALDTLSRAQRQAIVLHHLLDLPVGEPDRRGRVAAVRAGRHRGAADRAAGPGDRGRERRRPLAAVRLHGGRAAHRDTVDLPGRAAARRRRGRHLPGKGPPVNFWAVALPKTVEVRWVVAVDAAGAELARHRGHRPTTTWSRPGR